LTVPGRAPGCASSISAAAASRLVQDTQTGKRSLLMSTLPLQAKRPDGAFAPIDLSLESTAGGVGPKNSLAPFGVDPISAAKLSFPGKGVSVSVRGGERRSVQTASDRAFFANVLEDTDVGVIPLPDGAELFVVARSPQAPERFVLDIELPEGARLRQAIARDPIPNDPPKSLEIVRGEETLGYIHPPIAIDADGEAVPATMGLDGQSIVLAVPHRNRDIRYPVNVDPEMRLYSDYYADWLRWDWNQTRVGAGDGNFGAAKNDCAYYCGLYQSVPTNTTLTNGSYAQWYYRAPLNSYLYRTTFGGIAHNPLNAYNLNHTRAFQGLMNASYTAWESNVNYINQDGIAGPNPYGPHSGGYYGLQHDFCFNPRCGSNPAAAGEQNFALFGLQAQNAFPGSSTLVSGPYKGSTTMAWANVYLGDRRPPSLSTATPSSRDWTDEPADTPHTVTPGVHDDGLGIWGIGLDGAATGGGFVRHGCEGHIDRSPCPSDWSKPFTYTLNEGVSTLTAYGQDFVSNRTPAAPAGTWTEKIDRSPPTITEVRGPLADAAGATIAGGAYTLHVDATDGTSGGSPAQRRSGGKQITIRVSDAAGERILSSPARTCATDSCELHEDITISEDVLGGPGTKSISITASDQLGHQSSPTSRTLWVTVDDGLGEREQYTFAQEEVSSRLRVGVNVANGNLLVREVDYDIAESGLDLTQRRYYNSQSSGTGAYGSGWTALGRDLRVTTLTDGSVRLNDTSGYGAVFAKQSDGSFTPPRGTDADLRRVGDGYRLSRLIDEETFEFPLNGAVQRQTELGGKAVTYQYRTDGTQSGVQHSDGSGVLMAINTSDRITSATTSAGTHSYTYQGSRLATHAAPDKGTTSYTYDSTSGLLRAIDATDGSVAITYDSTGRVETVTTGTGTAATTITLAYPSGGLTTVTDATGKLTTHAVDRNAFVTHSRTGTNPPDVELSGSLNDRAGTLVDEDNVYSLQILGRRTGPETMTQIVATSDDGTELDADITCAAGCAEESRSLSFDTSEQADGEHTIRATVATSTGSETTRSLFVRTRPVTANDVPEDPAPTEQEAIDHDKSFRTRFGLNADEDHVRQARSDPAAEANAKDYGSPLYPSEMDTMDEREQVMSKLGIIEDFGHNVASDTYAGYYVDHANGGLIYVGFTAAGLARFDELKQQFPYPGMLRAFTALRPETELKSALSAVNAVLEELATTLNLATAGIDYQRNEVLIGLPGATPLVDAQLKLRFGLAVAAVEDSVEPLGRGDYRERIEAGLRIRADSASGGSCSSGFSARGMRRGRRVYRLTTADHCGDHTWFLGGKRIGSTVALGTFNGDVDAQLIKIPRKRVSKKIWFNESYSRRIHHVESIASEEMRGQIVCISGWKSVECGELKDRDFSGCYREGGVVEHCYTKQRAAAMSSESGDSGGAVYRKFSKDRAIAVGTVSGQRATALFFAKRVIYTHAERIERSHAVEICTLQIKC